MASRPRKGENLPPQRGSAPLSWDRIRLQMRDTQAAAEAVDERARGALANKALPESTMLALTMMACQLNMQAALIDAIKLLHDNARDREVINKEWLQEQLRRHAGGDWFTP